MERNKILKVGDSAAVTIPSSFVKKTGWKTGEEVIVDTDPRTETMVVRPAKRTTRTTISAGFVSWVEEFIDEHKPLLDELAKK